MKLDGLAVQFSADDALDPGRVKRTDRDMSSEEEQPIFGNPFATSRWTVRLNLRTLDRIVARWKAVTLGADVQRMLGMRYG